MRDSALKRNNYFFVARVIAQQVGEELMRDSALKPDVPSA